MEESEINPREMLEKLGDPANVLSEEEIKKYAQFLPSAISEIIDTFKDADGATKKHLELVHYASIAICKHIFGFYKGSSHKH
jgi:hypothetical protein